MCVRGGGGGGVCMGSGGWGWRDSLTIHERSRPRWPDGFFFLSEPGVRLAPTSLLITRKYM